MMRVTCSTPSAAIDLQRTEPARHAGLAVAVPVEDLERLDRQAMGVLETVGMREDLLVRELLGRLPLARRGRRQPGEDALGIGLRAAGEEAEAIQLRGEIVEQQPGARTVGLGVHGQTLSRRSPQRTSSDT